MKASEMKQHEFEQRTDRVLRLVTDLTAAEITDWLVRYHGLDEDSRENVRSNLERQMLWHRLRGRLDRHGSLAALFELLVFVLDRRQVRGARRLK